MGSNQRVIRVRFQLLGGRVGEWVSDAEEGTSYHTEHFRTVDSLGLLMRNGAITVQMHDAGQDFSGTFVLAQLSSANSPQLDRIPDGYAVWHVAGLVQSVEGWSAQEGWNACTLNQHEAKGILVGVLGCWRCIAGTVGDINIIW